MVSSRLKYSAVAGLISLVIFAVFGGIGGTWQGGAIDAASNPVSLVMLIPVVVMLTVSTKTRNIYEGIFAGLCLGTVVGLAVTTVLLGGVTSASILTFEPILNRIGSAKNIHPYRRANLLDGTANSLPAIVLY